MKVVFTDEALRDLDGILTYIGEHYPAIVASVEERMHAAIQRIGAWPESAPRIEKREGVRVVSLIPYPYRLFYQITPNGIEILHLHHAARRLPWESKR